MKIENFQSQVCVCAASTNLTCAKSRVEMGLKMKTLTMYLPQFHRTPENDEWWGEGFTEWTAVKAAKPLFEGHIQPKKPLDENYYDLLEKKTMMWQADLMKQYGIDGQCIYHYYFKDGRKILEKPAENLLEWKDIDMPFCLCWANERWARTWSINGGNSWADKFEKGGEKDRKEDVLLEQNYGREEEWRAHFEYLLPFFEDKRYIKLNGAPVFLIFNKDLIPCLRQMVDYWKKLSVLNGFPGIFFIGANTLNIQGGMDAILMNAPHMFWNLDRAERIDGIVRPEYQKTWENIISIPPLNGIKTYFGGVTNCDDSPRRDKNGVVYANFSIDAFEKGMTELYKKSAFLENEFVFINAWNEWGEGMYLEPDEKYGFAYLEAVKKAKETALSARETKDFCFKSYASESDTIDWKDNVEKNRKTARCFDRWMTLREEGKKVYDYLLKYGIKTVAIYGMGRLGKHLLYELKNSDIEIKYIIDRRSKMHHPEYQIRNLNEELEKVDAVIITPTWDFDLIYKELSTKIESSFFSLEELIMES